MEKISGYLELNRRPENREAAPAGLVEAEPFHYLRKAEKKIAGMIQFRHSFGAFPEEYGGHAGDSACPGRRRKGYAERTPAGCLKIHCPENSAGSRRIILAGRHGP